MNNTQKLLLRAMDLVPRKSKNALAEAIGANRSNLLGFFKGNRFPNATHAIKIAEILGMDVKEVIFYIQEDKTTDPQKKELLARRLPRLHSAAAIALALLAGSTFGGYRTAEAAQVMTENLSTDLHIMRSNILGIQSNLLVKVIRYDCRSSAEPRAL